MLEIAFFPLICFFFSFFYVLFLLNFYRPSVPVKDINLSRASSAGADCDRRRVIPVLSLGGSVPVINEMRVATNLFTERGYCTLVKTLLTL